jgi:hypothetical protein
VFSFFRRKPSLTDAQKIKLADGIAGILEVQLVMVPEPDRRLKDEAGKFRKKALGYIYGCIDAILTMKGHDMSDTSIGIPISFHVLKRLFPSEDAAKSLDYLVCNVKDPTIAVGMMTGGQQTVDFHNGKFKGSSMPMGLARFLLKGDDLD